VYAEDVYTCFVELEKAYDQVPPEMFWECCGSTVLTAALLLAVTLLYSCSEVVSVWVELNHNHSPWVLDFDKGVCCRNLSL